MRDGDVLAPVGCHERERGGEAGGAVRVGDVCELIEQQIAVGCQILAVTGPVGGEDPG